MNKDMTFVDPWAQSWKKIDDPQREMTSEYAAQVVFITGCLNFDLFIDIGPGYSFSEAWVVEQLLPSCKIVGFEPQTDRFDALAANEYPGQLYKLAVSEYVGMINANMGHREGSSNFKVHHNSGQDDNEYLPVTLPATTVDAILHGNPEVGVAFVWADVEGSELDVIRGAVLSMNARRVAGFLIELTTPESRLDESSYSKAVGLAAYHGFYPIATFNIQGTHFDCIFEYLDRDQREDFDNFITISQIAEMLKASRDTVKYPLGIGAYICDRYHPTFANLQKEFLSSTD